MTIDLMGSAFDLIQGNLKDLTTAQQNIVIFCRNWLNNTSGFEVKTSGSTGLPKTIFISRQQALSSVALTKSALRLQTGWHSLVCLNTDTIAGKMMLIRSLEIGMNIHVVKPSNNPFKEIKIGTIIDFVSLVPLQLSQILQDGYLNELNQTKAILVGGASIGASLENKIQSITTSVYSSYGMTETVSHIALRLINTVNKQTNYRKLPSIEIEKDDRDCLCIKGTVTNNQWIKTNDVVELLPNGYFKILGRIDNVVNSGGVKIQLEAIEQIIADYFTEQEITNNFFLTSIPHTTLGSQLVIVMEGEEYNKENKEELLKLLQEQCPKYKAPKLLFFVKHFLLTKSQKVDRIATRELIG